MHRIQAGFTKREVFSLRMGYEFKPKKWEWFAKLLWKILNKLGAMQPHLGEIATYHFHAFHEKKLADYIIETQQDLHKVCEDPEKYCLIMGRENFCDLMEENKPFKQFHLLGDHQAHPIGYNGRYMGLPVHVVNTMEGFAIIPKVIVEYKER